LNSKCLCHSESHWIIAIPNKNDEFRRKEEDTCCHPCQKNKRMVQALGWLEKKKGLHVGPTWNELMVKKKERKKSRLTPFFSWAGRSYFNFVSSGGGWKHFREVEKTIQEIKRNAVRWENSFHRVPLHQRGKIFWEVKRGYPHHPRGKGHGKVSVKWPRGQGKKY